LSREGRVDFGWFETSLPVADIAKSVAFYETLGFRQCDGSIESRNVTLQKGDCRLALFQGHLDPARPQLIFWQGDVEAIAADLQAKGVEIGKMVRDKTPGVGAMVFDPDGHPLYFVNIPGETRQEPR
jgi:predicted lactoylglutathione lyase